MFNFKPLIIKGFRLEYPKPGIALRQLLAAPLELLGAAGIIYFALPEAGNPGYFVVLGVFLASFSAALMSNAPGGLGVFELVFHYRHAGHAKNPGPCGPARVQAFLSDYSLGISIFIILNFERNRLKEVLHHDDPQADVKVKSGPDRKQAGVP